MCSLMPAWLWLTAWTFGCSAPPWSQLIWMNGVSLYRVQGVGVLANSQRTDWGLSDSSHCSGSLRVQRHAQQRFLDPAVLKQLSRGEPSAVVHCRSELTCESFINETQVKTKRRWGGRSNHRPRASDESQSMLTSDPKHNSCVERFTAFHQIWSCKATLQPPDYNLCLWVWQRRAAVCTSCLPCFPSLPVGSFLQAWLHRAALKLALQLQLCDCDSQRVCVLRLWRLISLLLVAERDTHGSV